MKKIFLIVLVVFFLCAKTFSQEKIDKYCKLFTTGGVISKGMNIFLDLGKDESLFAFKDKKIKSQLLKVEDYRSIIDALNYMSSIGWTLVSSTITEVSGTSDNEIFTFKRSFDASQLETASK
jgi:hypothetical protein